MRILIVDDSETLRLLVQTAIERLGHECLPAPDGDRAWALYQSQGAEVIVSDWVMPGLSGPELCRRVRAHEGGGYTYFIMLTALDDKERAMEAMEAGADDYLNKPFELHDLRRSLIAAQRVTSLHQQLTRRDQQQQQLLQQVGESQRRSETALSEAEGAKESVLEALRVRDAVLAAASHDLQTPLAAIALSARRVQRLVGTRNMNVQEVLDEVRQIEVTARKSESIISDLLDVAQLQAGKSLELDRRPVDLISLAKSAAIEHERVAERRMIRVESNEPSLVGDWDGARIERVLGNLLSNAVKYSPRGGDTIVRLYRLAAPDGDCAVLEVRDFGLGIPTNDLPHIFDPFQRASNVARQIKGTGIGLATARQVVEQHGGNITVESEEGVGSVFSVKLPLAPPLRIVNRAN